MAYGHSEVCRVERVPSSRYEQWLDAVFAGFGYDPATTDPPMVEFFRSTHPSERAIGGGDGATYVATAVAVDLELTLPGGVITPLSGVSCVSVDSTVRRRGLLSSMMVELHRSARERGFPIMGLLSSEWPIYGRFGYGPGTWSDSLTIDAHAVGWRADAPGSALQVHNIAAEESRELARMLHQSLTRNVPGEVTPPERYWDRFVLNDPAQGRIDMKIGISPNVKGLRRCIAVEDRGLAQYRLQPGGTPQGTPSSTLLLTDFLAADAEAAATLWRHLLSVDLVRTVKVPRIAIDHPLRWWVRDPRHIGSIRRDGLWLRPLDVPSLLERRRWHGNGVLTLSIHDKEGYAAGTYRLEIDESEATCRRCNAEADLAMDVSVLGSILLGGTSARGMLASGHLQASEVHRAQQWDALATAERAPFFSYSF